MKALSYLVTAGMLATNAWAMPAPEVAVMKAKLLATGDTVTSKELKAFELTMNRRLGSEAATSFTVLEDTGIRCITTPCPSTKNTLYRVTGVHASFAHGDSTRYEATEVLTRVPPNARIAPRKLIVTESSMELINQDSFTRRTIWNVEIERFSKPTQTYVGYPKLTGQH